MIRRRQDGTHLFCMAGSYDIEVMVGINQLLLTIGIYIYLLASAEKICMFIVTNGGMYAIDNI